MTRRQRKPTAAQWMHFLKEMKKARQREKKATKTPVLLMLPGTPPVKDGLADDCEDKPKRPPGPLAKLEQTRSHARKPTETHHEGIKR